MQIDPFNEFWNHAMILVGFYFSISFFWACCWGFSTLDPYFYRRLVNGRKGKTIMRFPTWRHRFGIKMHAIGCIWQVALNWQMARERERERERERDKRVDSWYSLPNQIWWWFFLIRQVTQPGAGRATDVVGHGHHVFQPRQEGWCYRWRIASRVGQDEAGTGCHGCIG